MYADTLDDLKTLISRSPQTSPSVFLRDDSFAAYCYDAMSVAELSSAFQRDPDPDQCRHWALSATQWKDQVAMAMAARKAADGD